jgi:uncharacterized protein
MKILIAGASGFIGRYLHSFFKEKGNQVFELVREKQEGKIYWDPEKKEIEKEKLENMDVIICLNGVNITKKRWSKKFKHKILHSRVDSVQFLSQTIRSLKKPPNLFIQSSGAGYYGDTQYQVDEKGPKGSLFLSEVCDLWEKASKDLPNETRSVSLRLGMVLAESGGALKKMLPLFKKGLGLIMGNGKTMISWVRVEDVSYAIEHIISSQKLAGPINLASPQVVSSKTFYQTLAKTYGHGCFLFFPKILINLVFGQMGIELFLVNTNIYPKKLLESGFHFRYKKLENAFIGEKQDEV